MVACSVLRHLDLLDGPDVDGRGSLVAFLIVCACTAHLRPHSLWRRAIAGGDDSPTPPRDKRHVSNEVLHVSWATFPTFYEVWSACSEMALPEDAAAARHTHTHRRTHTHTARARVSLVASGHRGVVVLTRT